jgi:TPR repeat protein
MLTVGFAGLPSAGKSTMINAMAGKRVLESGVCRTTTEVCLVGKSNLVGSAKWVRTELKSDDGVEFCALDLPGICDSEDKSGAFDKVTLDWASKCDVVAWVTDARTAFNTTSSGHEATEFARLRDAMRAASDEDGGVRQMLVVLAKYEEPRVPQSQRPVEYLEGEIRTDTEESTIRGSLKRTVRMWPETRVVKFSAHGRIAQCESSDALKALVGLSASTAATSNATKLHLKWASENMSKKRIAQLSRSLGLARYARDKARDGIQSLVYPARQWYMIYEATSSDAQCELGRICHDFEESPTKASRWFRKSAEQGNAAAQLWLGDMYHNGNGVALDLLSASRWYRKAAEQGNADAQYRLGDMYYEGDGVALDLTEAAKWYRKAAGQGDVEAQFWLGHMYYEGKGVALDLSEAVRWYLKAAEQGNADAQYRLGDMYFEGEGVALDFEEAAKWYRKAAEQGDSDAQSMLGHMYLKGNGVALDFEEAVKWYRKSADQGDKSAQIWLGGSVLSGRVIYSH